MAKVDDLTIGVTVDARPMIHALKRVQFQLWCLRYPTLGYLLRPLAVAWFWSTRPRKRKHSQTLNMILTNSWMRREMDRGRTNDISAET